MILMGKMGQEAFGVVDGPPAEASLKIRLRDAGDPEFL